MSPLVADNLFLALEVKHPDFGSMEDDGISTAYYLIEISFFDCNHMYNTTPDHTVEDPPWRVCNQLWVSLWRLGL